MEIWLGDNVLGMGANPAFSEICEFLKNQRVI